MQFSFLAPFAFLSLVLASSIPVPAVKERDIVKKQADLDEFLVLLLEDLPIVDAAITELTGILTDFEQLLADSLDIQTTENELGGTCTEYTIIFARGTTEPGNVGVLVGPPLFEALESLVGTSALTIQGVNDYAASIEGYLEGGDPVGSAEMAAQIEQAYADCPDTKLTISGYSQGSQLVHNAAKLIPADVAEWISSVVVFGDPDDGQALDNIDSSKVDTYCNAGDDICQDGLIITIEHIIYAEDATAAAAFIVAAAK